jgi:hypothetical protein
MPTPISVEPKNISGVGRVVIVSSDHRSGKIKVFCEVVAEKNGDSSRIAHSKLYRDDQLIFSREDKNFGRALLIYTDIVDVRPYQTHTYVWDAGNHGPVRNEKLTLNAQFEPNTSDVPDDLVDAPAPVSKKSTTPSVQAEINAGSKAGTFRLKAVGRARKNTADGIEAELTVFVNGIKMFKTGDHAFLDANLKIEETFPAMPGAKFQVRAELTYSYAVVENDVELTLSFS